MDTFKSPYARKESLGRAVSWKEFIRRRFASREYLISAFAICVFVIHVWAIYNLLKEVPAWVLRLSFPELVGVIAYTQVFALFESILIFLLLIGLGAVLPAKWYRNKFGSLSVAIVLITSAWFIAAQYNDNLLTGSGLKGFAIWAVTYLIAVGIAVGVIHYFKKLDGLLNGFAQRVLVLSVLYLAVDIFSIFVVIFRNV